MLPYRASALGLPRVDGWPPDFAEKPGAGRRGGESRVNNTKEVPSPKEVMFLLCTHSFTLFTVSLSE